MISRRTFLTGLASTPIAAAASAQLNEPRIEEVKTFTKRLSVSSALIKSARQQIGFTTSYDPADVRLDCPEGDIDRSKGVCTDVIIRAYHDAFDYDLQKAIHEHMRDNFSAYPNIWGLTRPDRNIDHRRVPNIECFLKRGGYELPTDAWLAGDLITCRIGGTLPHIGIVTAQRRNLILSGTDRYPYVIHNIGRGTREERVIGLYNNERHFRFLSAA